MPRASVSASLARVVRWYAQHVYGRIEGPGCTPFYCDRSRVGPFAISPKALARGTDDAIHQVLVTLSLYQARRDVDIMAVQRRMPRPAAKQLTSLPTLREVSARGRCELLRVSANEFDSGCDVHRVWPSGRAT